MLFYPGCHVRALYIGCIGTQAHNGKETSLLLNVKVMSSCIIASQHTQEPLEAYFKIKKKIKLVSKKKNLLFE